MSKKAKILLLISGIFALAIGLSNVFVNIFLWKKSSSFIHIAQYNLMHYVFIPIFFIVGGWISKKRNGIWPLRLGIASFMLFFIFILLFRNNVTRFIYPLGALFGMASGFYWLSFSELTFDFTTTTNNRDTFNGLNGCIMGIPSAIAPFASSYIIDKYNNLMGYFIVFAISLILFIVLILVSLLLRSEHYSDKLEFSKILKINNSQWKDLRKSSLAWGLRDVVILFLISVLLYKTTGSELAVGKIVFISYLISSAAHLIQQKIIKPKRRAFSLHIGSIFMFIAVLGLVIRIDYTFLIIYIILDGMFMPFFVIPRLSAVYNLLTHSHEESLRTEYIINNEIALNTGRIISTCILILLLKFVEFDKVLNYFLFFIGSSQFLSLYFLRKLKIWKK